MMRASRLLFDRYVPNSVTQYTSVDHHRWLSKGYRLAFTAIAYGALPSGFTLTLTIQHSGSGEAFKTLTALFADMHDANRVAVLGQTGTPVPKLDYVRIAIKASGANVERLRL